MKTNVLFFIVGNAPTVEETETILKLTETGVNIQIESVESLAIDSDFPYSAFQSVAGAVPPHIKALFDKENETVLPAPEVVADGSHIVNEWPTEKRKGK